MKHTKANAIKVRNLVIMKKGEERENVIKLKRYAQISFYMIYEG